MKKHIGMMLGMIVLVLDAGAEVHTWTSTNGETIEGEYVSVVMEKVRVKKNDGEIIKIPIKMLSQTDLDYIQLINPPSLQVGYTEEAQPKQYVADDWFNNFGGVHRNHPVFLIEGRFGALIKKTSSKEYNHPLTVELFVLTKQYYDPHNFHLIARSKSEPFELNEENEFQYEYTDKKSYQVLYYNLYSERPRGEKLAEYMILVWDKRGEIVAHKESAAWLYDNRDKLMELPVRAWMDHRCNRVHVTPPKRDT